MSNCDYRYHEEDFDFKCTEPVHGKETGSGKERCIFHDISYLKGNNYDKHKEEVANRFEDILSKNIPYFIGYYLPYISFH